MIDQATLDAAMRVLTCAPIDCKRESSCVKLALFVLADVRRELDTEIAKSAPPDDGADSYAIPGGGDGGWEAA